MSVLLKTAVSVLVLSTASAHARSEIRMRPARPVVLFESGYGKPARNLSIKFKAFRHNATIQVTVKNHGPATTVFTKYSCSGWAQYTILGGTTAKTLSTRMGIKRKRVRCTRNGPVQSLHLKAKGQATFTLPFPQARGLQQTNLRYFQLQLTLPGERGFAHLESGVVRMK